MTSLLLASSVGQGSTARPLVVDLLIMLACASLVVLGLRRLKLSTIPAYLICGALIGPSAFGLIMSDENAQSISGLAMVLLMFTIGLNLDPAALRGGMVQVLLVGLISTLGVILVSWPLGLAAGLSAPGALSVAMALSMSSTAVAMAVLQQRREAHRLNGRLCVGISITQDLLSLVCLASMPMLAQWAGTAGDAGGTGGHGGAPLLAWLPAGTPGFLKMLLAIGGIAVLIAMSKLILPTLLRDASRSQSPEVPLVVAAAAAFGAAAVASGLGFSPELGAFLAGFILAATPFRAQLAGQLAPIRDLFMAVFFTAVGLKLQLGELASVPGLVTLLVGVAAVITIKTFVIATTTWVLGGTANISFKVGLILAQAGEFSIVILTPALALGVIGKADFAIVIAIAVLSLALCPILYARAELIAPLLSRIPLAGWSRSSHLNERETEDEHARGAAQALSDAGAEGTPPVQRPVAKFVVIAGFGVVGRALADRFALLGVPFCIVDLNRQTVETQRRLGRQAVYGDISNPEVLEAAGVQRADAVMLTIPDDEAMMRACEAIRKARPDVFIAARTSFLAKAMIATALGADQVIVEEVATAETMARQVLDQMRRRAQGPSAS